MFFVSATVPAFAKPVIDWPWQEVGDALNHASALLASGAMGVSIRDDQGNHIGGLDLEICCTTGWIQPDLQPL